MSVPVVALAEERSNVIVISAPDTQIPVIEKVIHDVDVKVQDITELRVFRLKHADAQETADLLTSLLGDPSSSDPQNRQRQMPVAMNAGEPSGFGRGPSADARRPDAEGAQGSPNFGSRTRIGGGGGGLAQGNAGGPASPDNATRVPQQSKLVATADLRTGSVVVSAGRGLMAQVASIIEELDQDPAGKQNVYIFPAQHSDPQAVEQLLQSLFPQASGSYSSSALGSSQNQAGTQLRNRATQNQNQRTSQTGSGSMQLGSGSGLGR